MTVEKKSPITEWKLFTSSIRESFVLLRKNDPMRMAGATAFFTTFALPPIVFILAQLFGFFIGRRNMGRGLIENLSDTVGKEGAEQVRQVIRSIHGFNDSWFVIIAGFLFLVFVSTTLFNVIKNSLDQLWQVGVKERPGIFFSLRTRARSFAVILLAGLLFFADILLESMEVVAADYMDKIWKEGHLYFKSILANIGSVIIVTVWFILLFRFIADGRPTWKAAMAGGLLTGILFTAGKLLLRYILLSSDISNLYGSSGSFVLVLLFVFYSSFILYYGASFIAVYSAKKGWPVMPHSKAFNYRIQKVKNPML